MTVIPFAATTTTVPPDSFGLFIRLLERSEQNQSRLSGAKKLVEGQQGWDGIVKVKSSAPTTQSSTLFRTWNKQGVDSDQC